MLAANRSLLPTVFLLLVYCTGIAQQKQNVDRCATVELLQNNLERNPALKVNFERSVQEMRQAAALRLTQPQTALKEEAEPVYVPIVFHIVLQNPNLVSDAQIQAQLDTLNIDFAGLNSDSTKIPAAFKPLFGKAKIQFKMAQRTPNDEPTTGINRYVTTRASYAYTDNTLKYASSGGADAWDPARYLNIWVTNISGGILGYATFPQGSVAAEQGVVVLYSSLPGGSAAPYNKGRTLTHETGHYFFLYHIWGDDGGACSGSDDVNDTPNQTDKTGGCPSGVVTDACSPVAPGIMYQNYMDYTDDACMVMFTRQQATRMESAVATYRASLLTSNGADPVVLKNVNAALRSINAPVSRICNASFAPSITLRNLGLQTLTSANIYAAIDGGVPVRTQWTGSLASRATMNVTLNNLTAVAGKHTLKIYVADPNGTVDGELTNDTLATSFEYYPPVDPPLTEGFEGSTYPPQGWDILNPDSYLTWERVTGVAKTGNASVVMRNLQYEQNGPKDYLRLPLVNIGTADSAFLTFQVAAAVQTDPSTPGNVWDTLQVLVSTDCGNTYTSLYKKWGNSLITRKTATTQSFVPASTEWRKDSVDLTGYVGAGPIMLAFLNSSEYENNIYLDDINVYKVSINPNLRAKGVLVTPNPTSGAISVQFYPNPTNLKGIAIYNVAGQKVVERLVGNNNATTRYDFDLSAFANGLYSVRVVFTDRTVVQKVIKNK
ncbi:T9SS C-terminal target domain-containing protein [Paraflavitalea soli]|uniref:T9SS C-terminal target domain-containing protein n=1 Tax=Paraflavitalea soli TaxID=2315862 RepID=A0A3B7MXD4_9BACT|nr:M43 family zinc metalloprotease [Paraflavitalea soli]AXY75011.1 T9SS C-terminal target domain-containing protein [Paraflavitalea soli]